VQLTMHETVSRDLSRIRPRALARSYRSLLTDLYFLFSSLALAGAAGALYTQATVLPFILMNRVGLTATEFGLGMLMQSGSFFVASLIVRRLMGRYGAFRIVPIGLVFVAAGSIALAVLLRLYEPTFLLVMGPVALYAFGIAFVMPAMSTASVAPFPHMAGAAASMSGFLQMGGGLVGGVIAASLGNPVAAMSTVIPVMGLVAITSWFAWRIVPEPALARVVLPSSGDGT
jgi:MFS transporter, DHA1 family, multidrug resistance protein